MSGRVTPAVRSMEKAGVAFQLLEYDYDPSADAIGLQAAQALGRSPQPILVDISQETLAEMIGPTRSRVSYFMNKFRKLGLISYNGKIEVHNSLLNAALHEKSEIDRDDPSSKA